MVTSFTYEQNCAILSEYDSNDDPTKYQTINEWAREKVDLMLTEWDKRWIVDATNNNDNNQANEVLP